MRDWESNCKIVLYKTFQYNWRKCFALILDTGAVTAQGEYVPYESLASPDRGSETSQNVRVCQLFGLSGQAGDAGSLKESLKPGLGLLVDTGSRLLLELRLGGVRRGPGQQELGLRLRAGDAAAFLDEKRIDLK